MASLKSIVAATILYCAATLAAAQVVGIAVLAPGSSFYSVGTAVSSVMQQKAGLAARVQPMSGPSVYLPILNRGEVDFAVASALDVVNSYTGIDAFVGHPNSDIRVVAAVFVIPTGIAVRNDSPAKAIKDLKGVRMPTQFTAQASMRSNQNAMLAMGNISTADMKPYPVANYLKGIEALGENKVDAAMVCVGCAQASEINVALASHGGLRFISLPDTPDAVAAMQKIFPSAYIKVFQPTQGVAGIAEPTTLMHFSGFLLASAKTPDDVVYRTAKALFENKSMLESATVYLKSFDPNMMAEANVVPYHPGAEKFYREAGQWPPKKR